MGFQFPSEWPSAAKNAVQQQRVGRRRGNAPVADKVVEAVVGELRARSEAGMLKYKQPLTRKDWTRLDRLIHALQEACDLANYLMAEVVAEEKRLRAKKRKSPADRTHAPHSEARPQPKTLT